MGRTEQGLLSVRNGAESVAATYISSCLECKSIAVRVSRRIVRSADRHAAGRQDIRLLMVFRPKEKKYSSRPPTEESGSDRYRICKNYRVNVLESMAMEAALILFIKSILI